MSTALIDGPPMRRLFRFLRKSGLNYYVTFLATRVIKLMGNGFSFRRLHPLLAVGQSHLDAAWRWRAKQGILKARATFKKALDHIDELPEFSFAQPSPCYYWWMETYFPAIFTRIKTAVRKGQWLPVGGMWVEADCNVPSGESLVRQRLYGQRYYLRKFGRISEVEILQDCFGFNWNLPQILAKSGAKLFITGKLFWNDTNPFPLGMAMWEAPDGTKLPAFHMHFGYFIPINLGKKYPNLWKLGKEGKALRASYATPEGEIERWRSDELMPAHIFAYGLGDGGHGPVEGEIAIVTALARLYRNMKWARATDITTLFQPYYARWPTWKDEFYLEVHRGVYTSVARAKRFNRSSENRLEECEKLACLVGFFHGSGPGTNAFADVWKTVLFNQFHDILPGSSIPEVYADLDKDAAKVNQAIQDISDKGMAYIAMNVAISTSTRLTLMIFNPLSWARGGIIPVPRAVFSEETLNVLSKDIAIQQAAGGDGVLLKIPQVPPLGYQAIPLEASVLPSIPESGLRWNETDAQFSLENEHLLVKVNKTTGEIDGVTHKGLKFESIGAGSNKIRLFTEIGGKSDAWDIDIGYKNKEILLPNAAESVRLIEQGPLRLMVEVRRKYKSSTFVQRISISQGEEIITCDMDVDWREPHTMIKLCFTSTLKTSKVTCEIPYAYIDRPIIPKTKRDKARWEYCGQKWVSVSDGTRGVTILNNCKYGFNVEGQELRMTALRSPKHVGYAKETMFVHRAPDGGLDPAMPQYMDLGEHKNITYALYLHAGDWREEGWRKALELNHPLVARLVGPNSTNRLPASFSLASVDTPNVEVGVVKFWEDDPDPAHRQYLIYRLIERSGKQVTTSLRIADQFPVVKVAHTDLLERVLGDFTSSGNEIPVIINPYEIKTILVKFTG